MSRIKRSVQARKKHKKILEKAKGYYGARSRVYRVAKQAVIKSQQYAYRDRKNKKRTFRKLWIIRINAACRNKGIKYNQIINGMKKLKIKINRKILSDLCIYNNQYFSTLVEKIKKL